MRQSLWTQRLQQGPRAAHVSAVAWMHGRVQGSRAACVGPSLGALLVSSGWLHAHHCFSLAKLLIPCHCSPAVWFGHSC